MQNDGLHIAAALFDLGGKDLGGAGSDGAGGDQPSVGAQVERHRRFEPIIAAPQQRLVLAPNRWEQLGDRRLADVGLGVGQADRRQACHLFLRLALRTHLRIVEHQDRRRDGDHPTQQPTQQGIIQPA